MAILTTLTLVAALVFAAPAEAATPARCLDYNAVGMSGCSENPVQRHNEHVQRAQSQRQAQQAVESLTPAQRRALEALIEREVQRRLSEVQPATPPTQDEQLRLTRELVEQMKRQQNPTATDAEISAEAAREMELQEKIDTYYARHGKPPEEYVRFYHEPTVENALEVVRKQRDQHDYQMRLLEAMRQAEELLEQMEREGTAPPSTMPELPDFTGLAGSATGKALAAGRGITTTERPMANLNQNPFISLPGDAGGTVTADGRIVVDVPVITLDEGPQDTRAPVMKISYYFSAECPFCARFEPGFKRVLAELGNRAEVTCVDMSPTRRVAANIEGKLDCTWRAVQQGEMATFGVEATPTLIIDRGGGGPLERLSGFVDEGRLRQLLVRPTTAGL